MPPPLDSYELSRQELADQLRAWGFPASHAKRLWRYLYHERVLSLDHLADLPVRLQAKLSAEATLNHCEVAQETNSADGLTRKYLLALRDGKQVETVQMHYRGRATACLSTQVGCALGCVFCATGQMGFTRNLTAGEIVAQALFVARSLARTRLSNIVLMGMGEPLQNYDAVMRAVDILRDPGGLAIGAKQITLSTVGVTPGIIRLAEEARPISLAVSLHAATQEERAALLPVARAWPLDGLIDACRYYAAKLQRRIFFEWTLIAGQNDGVADAEKLGELLHGVAAHVNLIPLNPTLCYAGLPTQREAADRFQSVLKRFGLPSTVRQRRGIEIDAGCGQLAVAASAHH